MSQVINYSQCWEDKILLKTALKINQDDNVLSVTSGGDNSIALFLAKPNKIVLIDKNPLQNNLAELKLKSPNCLLYEEYLELLGVKESNRRSAILEKAKPSLSPETILWIDSHFEVLNEGLIHFGKFERFLNIFRKYLLPLAHSKNEISELLNQTSLKLQITYYETVWNTWRWKLFFKIASSRGIVRKHARQAEMSVHKEESLVYDDYKVRLEKLIHRSPLHGNYYMHYCLLGSYGEALPEYLTSESYAKLHKADTSNVSFVSNDILSYLKSVPSDTFSKFNLSDTPEAFDAEGNDALWQEMVRVSKNNARIVYWCNQIERLPTTSLIDNVIPLTEEVERLQEKDKVFFYKSFHIYTIAK